MAFLHLNFDNFEFRDLGYSDFLSFKVLAPTPFESYCVHIESPRTDRQTGRQAGRKADGQADRQTGGRTDGQADGRTDGQADIQTDGNFCVLVLSSKTYKT